MVFRIRLPYMRRYTKLFLLASLACFSSGGLGVYGVYYSIVYITTIIAALPIIIGGCVGMVLGLILGMMFFAKFFDMVQTDRRKERYRTVRTY